MKSLPLRRSVWLYPIALALSAGVIAVSLATGVIALKDTVVPLLSLFGTFLGATFAFRLTEEKEVRKLLTTQREAMNRALFVMIRQANAIHQLARDFEKYTSEFERAFNLPALKPPPYQDLVHNLADLEFLLESDDPALLMRIAIEQERFHQALESLKTRNEFYVGEVQPALANAALNGKIVSGGQVATLLGERLFAGAMNGAEIARQHIAACDASIPTIHKQLHERAKDLFPGHKFITYERAA
ncbi:hypothetical protein [Chitinivorax sp. B]|uniref:hypothetical protein n=1 Tax=Chitinivorax sp. B TaxID=2502235 RepID=UPI0010F9F7CB|nr:hypothetical protein [Chitinivorax sp. B]